MRNKKNYCSTLKYSTSFAPYVEFEYIYSQKQNNRTHEHIQVLLEQGAWLESTTENINVPDLTRKSLGTSTGLLQNELLRSRDVVTSSWIRILKFAVDIAKHKTSSIHSNSTRFVLSMFRLATVLSAYEKTMLSPFQDDIVEILRQWIRTARNEISSDGRKAVGNVPTLTVLYAHLALILSVDSKKICNDEEFLVSAAFVRTLLVLAQKHFISHSETQQTHPGTCKSYVRTTIL